MSANSGADGAPRRAHRFHSVLVPDQAANTVFLLLAVPAFMSFPVVVWGSIAVECLLLGALLRRLQGVLGASVCDTGLQIWRFPWRKEVHRWESVGWRQADLAGHGVRTELQVGPETVLDLRGFADWVPLSEQVGCHIGDGGDSLMPARSRRGHGERPSLGGKLRHRPWRAPACGLAAYSLGVALFCGDLRTDLFLAIPSVFLAIVLGRVSVCLGDGEVAVHGVRQAWRAPLDDIVAVERWNRWWRLSALRGDLWLHAGEASIDRLAEQLMRDR
jgi:hypothetical protein